MADQTRHQDQQREQRAPSRDQDRSSQNMGNRDREPAEGQRFDQDRNRDRSSQNQGNQNQGNQNPGKQNMNDQGRR